MTKKRFEEDDNGFGDNIKNEYFETNEEILDRLNTLHEENQELRRNIKHIKSVITRELGKESIIEEYLL